jgi:hypothetical protein
MGILSRDRGGDCSAHGDFQLLARYEDDSMIHDATVEVTCDGDDCYNSIHVQPSYVYMSYSGAGGHYDTSGRAIEEKLSDFGWTVEDGKHYCESCRPTQDEDEE